MRSTRWSNRGAAPEWRRYARGRARRARPPRAARRWAPASTTSTGASAGCRRWRRGPCTAPFVYEHGETMNPRRARAVSVGPHRDRARARRGDGPAPRPHRLAGRRDGAGRRAGCCRACPAPRRWPTRRTRRWASTASARCVFCASPASPALPQITLPLGTVDGAPFGLSLIGARNTDLALIELGAAILADAGRGAERAGRVTLS